jgi:hypothetical protein
MVHLTLIFVQMLSHPGRKVAFFLVGLGFVFAKGRTIAVE